MPKTKEMDKPDREATVRPCSRRPHARPNLELRARRSGEPKYPVEQCALADIKHHATRVEYQLCLRIVETRKASAIRFYGERAI